ncbi:MAG: hypothetical protein QNJ46_07935 [Leptolyngbyaceae cyanobacterium MO_188.B28]|nr:hypothetical protein [Leptolyngbyaceae cyanobacterium MO_188.B28]
MQVQAEFLDLKTQVSVFKQGLTLIEAKELCKVAGLPYFQVMQKALKQMLYDLEKLEAQAVVNPQDGETSSP